MGPKGWGQESQEELLKNWDKSGEEESEEERWDKLKKAIWKSAELTGMVKGMKGWTNNAWFNVECRTQRAKVWKCSKKFLAANKGTGMKKRAKKTLVEERKMLKELCEEKRKEWFEDKWNKIRNSRTMQEWWAAIKFYRPKEKRKDENIKKKEWVRHFAKLLGADNGELGAETRQRIVQSWEGEGESVDKRLDEKITRQELEKVISAFKNKKALGEQSKELRK